MLQAKSLRFTHPGQKPLDYDFQLAAGQKYWVSGPSGSGKSTLLKLLSGLLIPEEGEVIIDGESISDSNCFALRQKLVYLPQKLTPGPIKVSALFKRIFSLRANQQLEHRESEQSKYFEKFRLKESLLEQSYDELSGGEQQRVALVIALMLRRKIILLDESLSAIDQQLREIVLKELAEDPALVLLIAHDQPQNQDFKAINIDELKNN